MKKFFSKKKIVISILLLIAVFFVGKYFLIDSKKATVESVVVKKGDIKEELTLSGQIEANDHAVLSFAIAGRINWVGVKEGDWVKKGQAVASLDQEVLNAALRQAWQTFTAAKAESDKYYDGNHAGTGESYDQRIERTALDATQNKAYDNIRIAQENLKNAALYSPIEGLVVNANPTLTGVNITTLNSSYEIVNPSTIYLRVTADQTEVGDLKEGQIGMIVFDAYPDEQVKGEIKEIAFTTAEDEIGTVYAIKVVLNNVDNKDYKYRLGMTADINFTLKERKDVLVLPLNYVNSDNEGKYVLLGENRKKTYVETGIESEQDAEIIKGLSAGQVVYGL